MKRQKPIIAIDGPVGVGKSKVASTLADRLNFVYIDTGAMYRAVTLKALQQGIDLRNEHAVAELANRLDIRLVRQSSGLQILCDGDDVTEEIRSPEVSAATSPVADNLSVRERMVALQREMGCDGGIVMEGRDIATVVFPDADIKIYLDADPSIRAERRYRQLIRQGKSVDFESTYRDLLERDRRDKNRPVGALQVAKDAIVVDTGSMTETEVIDRLMNIVHEYLSLG